MEVPVGSPKKRPRRVREPLEQAVTWLARRDFSQQELFSKLLPIFGETIARQTLERCGELGYLDDRRLARRRAMRLYAEGTVGEAARARLLQGGLDEQLVDAALTAVETDAYPTDALRRLLERRLGAGPWRELDLPQRLKAALFAAGHGHREELIRTELELPEF